MTDLATVPDQMITVTPHHHGSHRQLLAQRKEGSSSRSTIDAIIVPTARHSASLRHAGSLSAQLGCPLVALCSKQASIAGAVEVATHSGIEAVAIHTTSLPVDLIPSFETSRLLADTPFRRRQDTSLKRNLGLLFAAVAGWTRVIFLDDDVAITRVDDLSDAASLLDDHAAVGLSPGGFPDNSVVCHAFREAGGLQDTFIGGGALAVNALHDAAFFPEIYNEDWFFLLDNTRLRSTAMIGYAEQRPYDPYADEERARAEEFGDCLAEGIFWLLDRGRRVKDADEIFWRTFIGNRRRFIHDVIRMVGVAELPPRRKASMVAALMAARERSQLIEPRLCVDYLRAWRADSRRWHRHIRGFRNLGPLQPLKILSEFGLVGCSEYVAPQRGVCDG